MKLLLAAISIFWTLPLSAQFLTGISTRWNDSFSEWILYTDKEDREGELRLRWMSRNDWTEWEYRLGESTGRIKLKWRDNPNEWEIRGDNKVVTARTLWNNNFREWRITDNNRQLTLKSRYGNLLEEWVLRSTDYGHFEMATSWEGDPRDWIIIDELDEQISLPMKMALVFVVVYHSSPKQ